MSERENSGHSRSRRVGITLREHARNKRIASLLIVFLLLVASFACGFAVHSSPQVMAALGADDSADASATHAVTNSKKSTYDSISARVEEAEDMLSSYSFDEVHLQIATKSMLEDMMKSTEDPYSAYFDQERYEAFIRENADKNPSGVGVLFGDYNGRAYAIDVLEGSEAQAQGVTQGDFVVSIDGDSSHQWSASEVIGALTRDDGENVVITWMRPISLDATSGKEFTTNLICRDYDIENVTYQLIENVGYVKLRQITGNSVDLVKKAIEDLQAQGAQAYVLDLDDNPGGFLTQSVDIASLFLQSGVVVGIRTLDGTTTKTATGQTITDAPLVIMINSFTSGVAEVLAAALQDNQRATSVGQTTTGKGSVQVTRELSFGGAIRYTAAYYLTPLGHEIHGNGVVPSIEVGSDVAEPNTQLLVALDAARSLVEG